MLQLSLALELKQAGLHWIPQLHDFFALPDTELQDRIFVVSDMTIDIQKLFGHQMITFNGALEWSLDYVLTIEAVWLPTEGQLRKRLQDHLSGEPELAVELVSLMDGHICRIEIQGTALEFSEVRASDSYGQALLYVLQHSLSLGQKTSKPTA